MKGTANALALVGSKIGLTGLLRSIGTAVMDVISSAAKIPFVGWALGIAASAGVAALGYSFMKGNDVFSPGTGGGGSYGQRMLMDKGAIIALNDSDNVIATTNPIKPVTKANDMYSQGTVTVANSTAPKPEPAPPPSYDGSNVVKALKDGFSKSVQVSRVS